MLLSKAYLYAEADQMTSFYARAFTHPARLEILRSLRRDGTQTVQQLSEFHPLTHPAFSQHLELLRHTQLIGFTPQYPYLQYHLDEEKYVEASEGLIRFLNELRPSVPSTSASEIHSL